MVRDEEQYQKLRQKVIEDLGLYPAEAFDFVECGLTYTVNRIHGPTGAASRQDVNRHVSGQQLCTGLRDYALSQWGMLARTVLSRWNITSTLDFGRIVFALVDSGLMQKQEQDSVEDFRNVFTFQLAFDSEYVIGSPS